MGASLHTFPLRGHHVGDPCSTTTPLCLMKVSTEHTPSSPRPLNRTFKCDVECIALSNHETLLHFANGQSFAFCLCTYLQCRCSSDSLTYGVIPYLRAAKAETGNHWGQNRIEQQGSLKYRIQLKPREMFAFA